MSPISRLVSVYRVPWPNSCGLAVVTFLLCYPLHALSQSDPAKKLVPAPDQGTLSPSGKFTPASQAPATNTPVLRTPAEAEAALRQAFNVQWLGTNTFRLGRVEFDKELRTVTLPARVCVRTQVVEYALVTEQGKTYESLLATAASPSDIHLTLLLLGISPVEVGGDLGKEAPVPDSNAIRIQVTWNANGHPASIPLSELISLIDERQAQPARPLVLNRWLYNGSTVDSSGFAAQREGSIISLIRDPAALINNPTADRDNDQIHFPNRTLLPPEGVPVSLTLRLPQSRDPSSPVSSGPPITPLSTNKP